MLILMLIIRVVTSTFSQYLLCAWKWVTELYTCWSIMECPNDSVRLALFILILEMKSGFRKIN